MRLIFGVILTCAPLMGLSVTAISMFISFHSMPDSPTSPNLQVNLIRMGLYSTIAGVCMVPVGIGIIIWDAVAKRREARQKPGTDAAQ